MPDPAEASARAGTRVCMRVNNEYTNDARVRREAETLAAAGYDITVIADARSHLPDDEVLHGVRVKRIRKTSRIPYWSIVRPLRDERADIYHAHDVDSLLPCLAAARLASRGARVIYDSHELWRAHARDKMHTRRRLLVRFEGPMVRAADGLISVSDDIVRLISERYRFRGPAVTVMNTPREYFSSELADAWALRDADPLTRIAYVSVFQEGRGAVQLINALEHLPADHVVELIGNIAQPEYERRMREAARPFGDRVVFAGRVPGDQVVPRLAAATLSAVLIEPISESYRMSAPNKMFESMAAGTPTVASDLPTIARITREEDAGVICDPSDPVDIARAVREACGRLDELREHARAAARTYNWQHEQIKLLGLYERLAPGAAARG